MLLRLLLFMLRVAEGNFDQVEYSETDFPKYFQVCVFSSLLLGLLCFPLHLTILGN